MASDFAIVTTTCGDAGNAQAIARLLVETRLAACVQIFPIESFYTWDGAMQTARELMLSCKIKHADYADVEAAIRAAHTYETPEIIEVRIEQGAGAYLAWIAAVTR